MPPEAPAPDPAWVIGRHAFLSLRALRRHGRTEIDPLGRRTPYQWQGFHFQDHDDEPFLLLHNSAGGFVEGDAAELHLHSDPRTRVLLTTTAATKFYKCERGLTSHDLVEVSLGEEALLEYLPDEVIPFAGSRAVRRTRLHLAESSRLFLSDLIAAGRVHYGAGEAFAFASMSSVLELRVGGKLLLLDRLLASGAAEVAALARLWAGYRHLGTVVAYAPDLPAGLEDAIAAESNASTQVALAVTRRPTMVFVRLLARETWQAHEAIYRLWEIVRPAIAAKPARPIRK